jgi:predicted permease
MYLLRDAYRTLRAAPAVSAIAILSLGLGIGANTAMFSILDRLLLRALPVRDASRLAVVGSGAPNAAWTNPVWEEIRNRRELFDGAFAWSSSRFNLAQGGRTEFVDGVWTSGRYFDVLGVRPILGRTWNATDDARGGGPDGPAAVISYAFWQRRFGGAADVVGRSITVERVAYTIVGVTPPGFFGVDVGRSFDIAIPLGTEPLIRGKESSLDRRSSWWLNVFVRLHADQSMEAGTAALRGVQPQIRDATVPPNWREEDKKTYLNQPLTLSSAATGLSALRSRYRRPLTTIMVVVGLVLLIACANIANLLLARATARRHELSVRLALGASRWRLAQQLLAESLLLAGIGGILGLVFAQWFSRLLVRQLSDATRNVYLDLSVDWRMLLFTGGVAVTTAIVFGVAPAMRATRVQPNDAIKEHGRTPAGQSRFALGNLLVVVQVALSLMLVVGAGLFVRTFTSLSHADIGFERDPVLIASINAQPLQLDSQARRQLFLRLRDAAAAVPGAEEAALSVVSPISGSSWNYELELVDGKRIESPDRLAYANFVTPGWFKTYGTHLIAGRDITESDVEGSPDVVIVNEAFARKFLAGANPIGHRIREPAYPNTPNPEREIVGYVANAAYRGIREAVPPTMYIPYRQNPTTPSSAILSIRTAAGSPMLLANGVTSALTQVNPNISITLRPLADQVGASLTQERLIAMLSAFFGGLALLLAGLGLYGVTAYAVSRRRTEIGIRLALGADPRGVIGMVLKRVATLVLAGVAIGAVASLWAGRFVATLLYGLESRDPLTFVGAAVTLTAIGALAGFIPAARASRIDPAEVLRNT